VDRTDSSQHATLKAALASGLLPGNIVNNTSAGMKNTLFDEGIRIAQQYGMCDFADELKTLQGGDDEEPSEKSSNQKGVKRENENAAQSSNDTKKIKNLSSGGNNPSENSRENSDENSDVENGLEEEVTSHSPLMVKVEVDTENGV